jgi:NAD(P)-dependent dehydrogenase (short-subunit alcohol dehydrogenase family)
MLLQDKVVVVTGVGPGLGRSMALAAADEGARVVCMARTESFVTEVVDEIAGRGGEALGVPGDITSVDDCTRVAAQTEARFGRLDGLVNSAFTAGTISLFEDVPLDDWRHVFEVNVFGTLTMIRACLPLMSRDGGGAIVNVNTMSATRPMRMQGAYGGSKAALEFLTRQLAVELGPRGIRCNTVYCGPMLGPNLADAMDKWAERRGESREEVEATVATNMAIGRIPEDEESARVMMLLLSDHAGIVTGAALHATGGVWLENKI